MTTRRVEIQLTLWEFEKQRVYKNVPKTGTAVQAFCKVCKKGVTLPHICKDGSEIIKVKPDRRGI